MEALTDRQQLVLDFIRASIVERGYPPTLREIGVQMGIRSTNGVNDHLRALERKGHLCRDDMKSRALRPTVETASASVESPLLRGSDNDTLRVPLLGRVAAGLPSFAEQSEGEALHVGKDLLGAGKGDDVFALRIRGESMIEAGVFDGDYVFVRRAKTANKGDMVIALVEDEATCKYYFPERDMVRLQPANASMGPILVRASNFRETSLLGVVVGVFRSI